MTVNEALKEFQDLSDSGFGDCNVIRTNSVWDTYEDLEDFSFIFDGDERVVRLEFEER